MADFQVAWKASTRTATIQAKGDALPAGAVRLGYFKHDDDADNLGDTNGNFDDGHVFYHHVRDALYGVGVQNMQNVRVDRDVAYTALTNFTITQSSPQSLAVSATLQLTHAFTPGGASNQKLYYTSSVPAKATVSASGLVTGVAAGATVITVTSDDGAIVKTITINVS